MRVHIQDKVATVQLSRRNLEHLLTALDAAEDRYDPYLMRSMDSEEGPVLYVFAEEDEQHYDGRIPGPGFERLVKEIDSPDEFSFKQEDE